jgi:hypothetical protein
MPLYAAGSPLARGMGFDATMAQPTPKTVRVRVLRAFYAQGKLIEVDAIVTLEQRFAIEMRTAHKVEFLPDVEAPAATPTAPARKTAGNTSKET